VHFKEKKKGGDLINLFGGEKEEKGKSLMLIVEKGVRRKRKENDFQGQLSLNWETRFLNAGRTCLP